ncbi:MAG: TIM barrel protein [Capsulimonadales bacterium]|nr:TIM barrel protein [Capsulimonadales bacterium]
MRTDKNMRFGIGSYTYAWAIGVPGFPAPPNPLDAFRLLDRTVGFGLSVVQICDNLPLTDLAERDLQAFAERAFSAGVHIEIGTRGIDETNLRQYLALARRFRSPFVRVVIDRGSDEPSPEETVRRLRPLVAAFAAENVVLALENHDRFPADILADIVERLGPETVGICLDTVNSFGSLEGPDVVIPTLAPYAVNLHIKDFSIRRATHNMGFLIEGQPAGQGRLNIPELLTSLPKCQTAILELWTPYQETIARTVALEAQWADESVIYLKSLLPSPA